MEMNLSISCINFPRDEIFEMLYTSGKEMVILNEGRAAVDSQVFHSRNSVTNRTAYVSASREESDSSLLIRKLILSNIDTIPKILTRYFHECPIRGRAAQVIFVSMLGLFCYVCSVGHLRL
jgi:hypothetical protein